MIKYFFFLCSFTTVGKCLLIQIISLDQTDQIKLKRKLRKEIHLDMPSSEYFGACFFTTYLLIFKTETTEQEHCREQTRWP